MLKSNFLLCLEILALLIVTINAQYSQGNQNRRTQCTVDGEVGMCKSVRDCQVVTNILQQSREQALAYLRRNHCGFDGANPLVCCRNNANVNPRPGNTFSNTGGNNWQNRPGNTPGNTPSNTPAQSDNDIYIDLTNNPLLPSDCGRDLSQRIVGGEITELDEFPWMALLEYQKPDGRTTACGGVLISRRYVLTAAHCVKGRVPSTWRLKNVRLGEYNLDTDPDCVSDGQGGMTCAEEPVSVGVEEQIVHEDYRENSKDQTYDIALLRLNHDVRFTKYIKAICLPSSVSFGNTLYVAGWGKTENRSSSDIKMKLALPLANRILCDQTYSTYGIKLGFGQICAGGQRGKDSCRGDSGGPLMAVERITDTIGKWTAVGVVSLGPSPCGVQGWPGIYTKVIDFVPWILSKMRP